MTQEIKIDLYTKIILSVIAISLFVIATKSVATDAYASSESDVQKVVICHEGGYPCVGILDLGTDDTGREIIALRTTDNPDVN